MTADLRTEILADAGRLAHIEPEWWRLWRACPKATPFQSPAWLLAWWQAFAPGDLATVAVWDGADLVGLAPLYREAGTARLLPLGIGITDYLDVLLDPVRPREAGVAIEAALADVPGWTTLSFEELAPGADALALPASAGWSDELSDQSACPVLALPQGQALEQVIPAPKLRKLRMARHRVARRMGQIERADAASAALHLDALFRLHAARWESRGEPGVLAHEAVRRFHKAALPGLVAQDLLRSYLLRIEGRVAGIFYGFQSGARLLAYLGGFDPDFGFESPGTVLIGHAIEQAIGEGVREVLLLRGQEPYKYEWGATDRWNKRRVIGRPGARAAAPLSLVERGCAPLP